ncbi:MAG: PhzF family phenazine biosynthesis protein [Halioglobus sp.]|jgi:PhzF family phenazine biosynthesis protein
MKLNRAMNQKIYQVDAFASKLYEGNPAAVCVLDHWLSDETMQNIAMENNLAETAFLVESDHDSYCLRWFTPTIEVDLCGHATLASAHILFSEYGYKKTLIKFETRSGVLSVQNIKNEKYLMDFPTDTPIQITDFDHITEAMNVNASACYKGKDDYLLILENEQSVLDAQPDLRAMLNIKSRGVLLTAKGDEKDFVSRCFFPNAGVDEDPVTGSAHTLMVSYWAHRLLKNRLNARQISYRPGDIECIYKGDRIALIGKAKTYLKGMICV